MLIEIQTENGLTAAIPANSILNIVSDKPNAKSCTAVTPMGEITVRGESISDLKNRVNQAIIDFNACVAAAMQKKIQGDNDAY